MKTRIKIDSAILSFIIILTGFLYQFPWLYTSSPATDNMLDFIGLIVVLKGTYLRMTARGYKKSHSQGGHGVVMTGPYSIVRNPMYLGSFLMGAGFVLIVWPWWTLPIFGYLFYLRFIVQIKKEELYLHETFGRDYDEYTKKVPRFFPRLKDEIRVNRKEVYPFDVAWSTKEKWGLVAWPVLAVFLEAFQENIIFGFTDFVQIIFVFSLAIGYMAVATWIIYKRA